MSGHRPSRPAGSSPLDDVVGWFHGWLGKRRESLGRGDASPGGLVLPSVDDAKSLLRRGAEAIRPETFDRALRTVLSGGEGAADLPADADVDSITVPADFRALGDNLDWSRPPENVMRRPILCAWLERWYRETDMETIGGVGEYVRRPWVRAGIGAVACHLNANTTRGGVAEYLELARQEGPRLPWFVVPSRRGIINEVAVGRNQVRIRGFHLFTDSVFKQSGRIGGARPADERNGRGNGRDAGSMSLSSSFWK